MNQMIVKHNNPLDEIVNFNEDSSYWIVFFPQMAFLQVLPVFSC